MEFETGLKIQQIGFIYQEGRRVGVSPDGIIPNKKIGVELKCPITAKVHADFLCNDKIKSEYQYQVQLSLYVSGYDSWIFASFNPSFKSNMLSYKVIEKDKSIFDRFDNELPFFINDLDESLSKIGLKWGDQWPL